MRLALVTGLSQLPSSGEVGANVVGSGAALDPLRATLRLRPARLARMDRLCALAMVAADAALDDAGWTSEALAGLDPARVGVVVGTRFGCHATNEDYFRGLLADGPRGASPRLFAYTLPSSPLGELAIHFGARGPAQTICSGRQSGVEALARAATLCAGGRADLVIAVAVEVGGGALVGAAVSDGAVAVVVEAAGSTVGHPRAPRGRIAGAAMTFAPGDPERARREAQDGALADAGLPPRAIPALPLAPGEGAVDGPRAFAGWLEAGPGEGSTGVLVDGDGEGGAAALVAVAMGTRGTAARVAG